MIVMEETCPEEIIVVHPMFDEARDEKRSGEGLGLIKMSPAVRVSLLLLRLYLVAMAGILVYHLLGSR